MEEGMAGTEGRKWRGEEWCGRVEWQGGGCSRREGGGINTNPENKSNVKDDWVTATCHHVLQTTAGRGT